VGLPVYKKSRPNGSSVLPRFPPETGSMISRASRLTAIAKNSQLANRYKFALGLMVLLTQKWET
jgi:hypothetical protein